MVAEIGIMGDCNLCRDNGYHVFDGDVMRRITVVIEYENEADVPCFRAQSVAQIDGGERGKVVTVAFEDALNDAEEE